MCIPLVSPVTSDRSAKSRDAQRGLSLVELMVAMAIGLITVLAISQSMSFFEAQKKGVTTGADAQSNGAFAAYLVERDLRMAGYGVFSDEGNLIEFCANGTVRAYNSERSPQEFTFSAASVPFVPVSINPPGIPAGDANTDVVGVAFSDTNIGVSGKGVRIGSDNGAAFTVQNAAGFVTGDAVLIAPVAAGSDCSIYEITDGPGVVNCSGGGGVTALQHGTAAYANRHRQCTSVTPSRNKNGGLGVLYQPNSTVFNLGRTDRLAHVYYAVRGGQLTRCDYFQADCSDAAKVSDSTVWVPIADGIVALRAEFGIAGAAGAVDTWRSSVCAAVGCTPTLAEWQALRVVRIAVVARSKSPPEDSVTTTANAPSWNQGGVATPIALPAGWKDYRYHTTEIVIPLRNIIWGASS